MVTTIIIIEMMGRPPEHLKKGLMAHLEKFGAQKNVEVIKQTMSEPRLIDENNELYTIFSEVEFTCPTLLDVMNVIFDYMPASVEIVDPQTLSLPSDEATEVMNSLAGRLHKYDDVAKIMKNRENKFAQEMNMAKKLLLDHNIINKEGKVIKHRPVKKEEEVTKKVVKKAPVKKKAAKKKVTKKKVVKKVAKKKKK